MLNHQSKPKVTVTIRLLRETAEELREKADQEHRSISALAEWAVASFLRERRLQEQNQQ